MKYSQVKAGTLSDRNAAFICLHTKPYKHYSGADKDWGEKALNADVTLFGAVVRWSGAIGFPGVKVEPEETIYQAAARECYEEIGYKVNIEKMKLFCSHIIGPKFNSHLFTCEVTPNDLYEIQKNACNAEHAHIEGCGMVVYHSTLASKSNILATPGAKTVLEELELLMAEGVI